MKIEIEPKLKWKKTSGREWTALPNKKTLAYIVRRYEAGWYSLINYYGLGHVGRFNTLKRAKFVAELLEA